MVDSLRFLALNESCDDEEDCGSSQDRAGYQVVRSVVFLLEDLQIELLAHTDHLLQLRRLVVRRPAGSEM